MITFADCVFDRGDIVEVRRLPSGRSTWHKASELSQFADRLAADNQIENVFVGINPRKASGGRAAGDVSLARVLWADFDNVTIDIVRRRLETTELPPPTLLVNSGHGCHAYWRLSKHVDVCVWSILQRDLAALLDSDGTVHDFPRLTRLPGLVNHKPPEALCRIVASHPERRVELAKLRECIPLCSDNPAEAPPVDAEVDSDTLRRARQYAQTWEITPAGHRNAAALKHAAALVRDFALCDNDAWPILVDWNAKNDPPLPKTELRKCLSNGRRHGKHTIGNKRNEPLPTLPWEPFPINTLPSPVCDFVAEGSSAIGCDPAYVALPALATLASAIGTTRRIRLKRTWREPAIIWAVIVGRSGTLKSPALDLALRLLRKKQSQAFQKHAERLKKFERESIEYQAALSEWKRKGRRGGQPQPEKPEAPTAKRFICSDTTVEALATLLQDNPRGLLLARDELSGWLGSFDAYKHARGADAASWLELHCAGHLVVDRKTGTPRTIHVPRAAVSLTGCIQPRTFQNAVGSEHRDNGLAARLLLSQPPIRRKQWTDDVIDPYTVDRMATVIDCLLALDHTTGENGEPIPVDVPLSCDGRRAWIGFYNEHAGLQADAGSDDLAAAFSKLEGYAARFALIFHFVRLAASDPTLADGDAVDAESIKAGAALARWFCREAERLYASFAESGADRRRRELVEWIGQRGGTVTVGALQRGHRRFKTAADARSALQSLVQAGIGRWRGVQPDKTGGRPSEHFELTKGVYVYETPSNDTDNKGFVDVDAVDDPQNTLEPPTSENHCSDGQPDKTGGRLHEQFELAKDTDTDKTPSNSTENEGFVSVRSIRDPQNTPQPAGSETPPEVGDNYPPKKLGPGDSMCSRIEAKLDENGETAPQRAERYHRELSHSATNEFADHLAKNVDSGPSGPIRDDNDAKNSPLSEDTTDHKPHDGAAHDRPLTKDDVGWSEFPYGFTAAKDDGD